MFQTYLIVRGSMLRCHGHLFITSCCSGMPDSIPPSLMTFHVLQPLANPRIRHLRTVVISNPWPKNYFQYLWPTRHYLQWVCLNFPANCSMTLVRSGSSALVSATLTQWDKSATIFKEEKMPINIKEFLSKYLKIREFWNKSTCYPWRVKKPFSVRFMEDPWMDLC